MGEVADLGMSRKKRMKYRWCSTEDVQLETAKRPDCLKEVSELSEIRERGSGSCFTCRDIVC